MVIYKKCCICYCTKLIKNFYKDKSKRTGYSNICALCSKKYSKLYSKKHKEQCLKYSKKYRKENREKMNLLSKNYYKIHQIKLRLYRKKYQNEHKEEIKKQQKLYRLNNPDKIRNHDLKSNHGITLKEYNILFKKQHGLCAICKQKETDKDKNKKTRSLAVDHDHKTEKIRGLLCGRCNKGLGVFKDDIKLFKEIIKYLGYNQ